MSFAAISTRCRRVSGAASWSKPRPLICGIGIRRSRNGISSPRSRGTPAAACCAMSTTSTSAPAIMAGSRQPISRRWTPLRSARSTSPVMRSKISMTASGSALMITGRGSAPKSGCFTPKLWRGLRRFRPSLNGISTCPRSPRCSTKRRRRRRCWTGFQTGSAMPRLLELQRAMYLSLVELDDREAAPHIVVDGLAPEARLNIYRNTFIGSLTNALRLCYPAIHRLVGAEFFAGATARFIPACPPETACLDDYGEGFAAFLAGFPPAAGFSYLTGVARLEWAVFRALRAPDRPALDPKALAEIDPAEHPLVCFTPHPAVGLVADAAPVDLIWRAVIDRDDAALGAIDLAAGPVWLL